MISIPEKKETDLRHAGYMVLDEFGIPLTELMFSDITDANEFIHNYFKIIVDDKMSRYKCNTEERRDMEQIIWDTFEDYYNIINIYRRKQGEAEENDIKK